MIRFVWAQQVESSSRGAVIKHFLPTKGHCWGCRWMAWVSPNGRRVSMLVHYMRFILLLSTTLAVCEDRTLIVCLFFYIKESCPILICGVGCSIVWGVCFRVSFTQGTGLDCIQTCRLYSVLRLECSSTLSCLKKQKCFDLWTRQNQRDTSQVHLDEVRPREAGGASEFLFINGLC